MKKLVIVLLSVMVLILAGCDMAPKPPDNTVTTRQQLLARLSAIKNLRSYHIGQVYTIGETVTLVINTDFLFYPDSSNLTPDAKQTLQTIADLLNTFKTVAIKINAYSDNQGDPTILQALTTQQAEIIENELYAQDNVDTRLMIANGYGSSYPIAPNNSATGRALNRRVVIEFRFIPDYIPYG